VNFGIYAHNLQKTLYFLTPTPPPPTPPSTLPILAVSSLAVIPPASVFFPTDLVKQVRQVKPSHHETQSEAHKI